MKQNRIWKWACVFILAAIVGSCGVDMPKEKQSSFETMIVKKSDLEVPVKFSAKMKGQADVTIMPQVSGQLMKIYNCHDFIPATHALAVSEGKCYVIGYGFGDNNADGHYLPVLYTNYKKEFLPMPGAAITGECRAIYAYDRDHTIIGGIIGGLPAVWVDKEYEIYSVSCPRELSGNEYLIGSVESVTKCNEHIYAAGFEVDYNKTSLATLWTDGAP